MSNLSNGQLERKVKGEFRFRCQAQRARCAYCRQKIDYSAPRNHPESFEAAHKYPVKSHPHLAYDIELLRPSHSKCNRSAGAEILDEEAQWVIADWG